MHRAHIAIVLALRMMPDYAAQCILSVRDGHSRADRPGMIDHNARPLSNASSAFLNVWTPRLLATSRCKIAHSERWFSFSAIADGASGVVLRRRAGGQSRPGNCNSCELGCQAASDIQEVVCNHAQSDPTPHPFYPTIAAA